MCADSSKAKLSNAEANRQYFDHISDAYDGKPWFAKVNQQVTDALRARLDWVGIPFANTGSSSEAENVRQLDYACGPGLMSRVYGPYVTVTRGVDISPNMVANYNARGRAAGLPPSTIQAAVGDLFDKENPTPAEFSGPEWQNFDLATAGFAFHHFEDVVYAAKCLKARLRPGGALVITDFLEGGDYKADEAGNPIESSRGNHAIMHTHDHGQDGKEHHHHGHHHHHHHHEQKEDNDDPAVKFRSEMNASIMVPHFTLDGVKKFFTEAGFVDVDVVTMEERVYMEFGGQKLWRTMLFAKGRRPAEGKSEL